MGKDLKQQQYAWAVAWQDQGDQAALAALVESVRPLCVSVAARHNRGGADAFDDLFAECRLAVVEAAAAFDRGRPEGFVVLAGLTMLGRCRVALKRFVSPVSSGVRVGLSDSGRGVPVDDEEGMVLRAPVVDPFAGQGLGLLPILIQEAGLDERQHDVLGRHKRDETLEAVGLRWGVSTTRVGQIEHVALSKVRAAAERKGLELRDLL